MQIAIATTKNSPDEKDFLRPKFRARVVAPCAVLANSRTHSATSAICNGG